MSDLIRLDRQLDGLRPRGVSHAVHPARARLDALQMAKMATTQGDLRETVSSVQHQMPSGLVLPTVREGSSEVERIMAENQALADAMGSKRLTSRRLAKRHEMEQRRMQRTASTMGGIGGGSFGGDAMYATPRFQDPVEYFDLTGVPWNMADEGHRERLHKWLRLFASTHYLVPSLIDIFTRFPLAGMELKSKDKQLTAAYEDMFFENLKYPEFFVDLGREYWTVGEAFTLAHFNDDLNIFEFEEFIQPQDVTIERFPILNTTQMKVVPPPHLRQLANEKRPAREYEMLVQEFEELIPYLQSGKPFPVSEVLMKQVANKVNPWDDHGTPILLRGLRTLLHEETLLASQDAIAQRLYSPLILAKLGIMDLGDNAGPWIPTPAELDTVRDDLDVALASDFRVMVHHFGLEIESVFGREQMPRLGEDFDRVERRLMQVFGINPSLLSAGSNSQPYASSALQAEYMNQMLRTYQGFLKDHYRARALVVAEANGHYDYYMKGDKRIDIMERVVEYDDAGVATVKEVPKLLVPDLEFPSFDLRDEATERQFLQTLRTMGVPIPNDVLAVGIPDYDNDEWSRRAVDDLIEGTVNQQAGKVQVYKILWTKGYPIPADLKAEVEAALTGTPSPAGGMPGGAGAIPMGGGPAPGAAGAPGESIIVPPAPPGLGPGNMGGPVPGGGPPPAGPITGGPPGAVPEVSNERRPGMPTPTSRVASVPRMSGWWHAAFEEPLTESWGEDPERDQLAYVMRRADRRAEEGKYNARTVLAAELEDYGEDLARTLEHQWLNEHEEYVEEDEPATVDDPGEPFDMNDEGFKLGQFEEVKEDEDEEGRKSTRVVARLTKAEQRARRELLRKRYSIIDDDREGDDEERDDERDGEPGAATEGPTDAAPPEA